MKPSAIRGNSVPSCPSAISGWRSAASPLTTQHGGNYWSLFNSTTSRPQFCWIAPIPRSHQEYGCITLFWGDLSSSGPKKIHHSKLQDLCKNNRSRGTCSILSPDHVPQLARRCTSLKDVPCKPGWKVHRTVPTTTTWQCNFHRKSINSVHASLCATNTRVEADK